MTGTCLRHGVGLCALLTALAACGNDPQRPQILETAYQTLFQRGEAAPSEVTGQQILATLQATDRPVIYLSIEDRNSQALAVEIEQNGAYDTFATTERQSFTLRNGHIVATRGLGGDLMSVEEDAVLALIRARQAGTATYVMRFLTAEDVTEELTYRCGVEPDKTVPVSMGLINATGTEMVVACTGEDGPPFVDYFVVSAEGEILGSKQWLGTTTGYVAMHRVRL